MKAIEVRQNGGPEVLEYSDLGSTTPKASEVSVRVAAAGVNLIDVYLREGRYPATLSNPSPSSLTAIETSPGSQRQVTWTCFLRSS